MNESNQAQAIRQQIECVRDEAAVLLSGLPSTKEETLARIDKMGNALMDAEDILKGKMTAEAVKEADEAKQQQVQHEQPQQAQATKPAPTQLTEPVPTNAPQTSDPTITDQTTIQTPQKETE